MLSYQHGYHAGGIADVHKHVALCLLLGHLRRKPAPFCVIDAHAGRGLYDLTGDQATKTNEWQAGIARLIAAAPADPALRAYLDVVSHFNASAPSVPSPLAGEGQGEGALPDAPRRAAQPPHPPATYPGSPAIAAHLARPGDRLVLVEAHPAEHAALRRAFRRDRRVHVHKRDANEALPALVPPAERRGLVLVDPSYEVKTDYAAIPAVLEKCLRRWPAGIYAVWYPLLPDARHAPLLEALRALPCALLTAELAGPARKRDPSNSARARGLIGTGLAVLNPPWQFAEAFAAAGAELAAVLFGPQGRHVLREPSAA